MRLENKVALVTGGGSGLGEATSLRFAEEGATVIVSDIHLGSAQKVASAAAQGTGSAEAHLQDVTDEARWEELVAQIVEQHGHLDVLVNNAGIAIPGNAEDTTLADWQRTQSVNLDSVFLGTRAAIRAMKDRGGSIINISSIEGIVGEPNAAAYNASKGGVRIFTKSAALHCAASGYGIRVNSIHPGFIRTPMLENAAAAMDASFMDQVLAAIPLGEPGAPLDIANGALFLASDESRYMTGAELVIDGGYTAH
jgi:NAD(P)-dependent dehydrogenase (short-subunit alcohol dehydrogenase family)